MNTKPAEGVRVRLLKSEQNQENQNEVSTSNDGNTGKNKSRIFDFLKKKESSDRIPGGTTRSEQGVNAYHQIEAGSPGGHKAQSTPTSGVKSKQTSNAIQHSNMVAAGAGQQGNDPHGNAQINVNPPADATIEVQIDLPSDVEDEDSPGGPDDPGAGVEAEERRERNRLTEEILAGADTYQKCLALVDTTALSLMGVTALTKAVLSSWQGLYAPDTNKWKQLEMANLAVTIGASPLPVLRVIKAVMDVYVNWSTKGKIEQRLNEADPLEKAQVEAILHDHKNMMWLTASTAIAQNIFFSMVYLLIKSVLLDNDPAAQKLATAFSQLASGASSGVTTGGAFIAAATRQTRALSIQDRLSNPPELRPAFEKGVEAWLDGLLLSGKVSSNMFRVLRDFPEFANSENMRNLTEEQLKNVKDHASFKFWRRMFDRFLADGNAFSGCAAGRQVRRAHLAAFLTEADTFPSGTAMDQVIRDTGKRLLTADPRLPDTVSILPKLAYMNPPPKQSWPVGFRANAAKKIRDKEEKEFGRGLRLVLRSREFASQRAAFINKFLESGEKKIELKELFHFSSKWFKSWKMWKTDNPTYRGMINEDERMMVRFSLAEDVMNSEGLNLDSLNVLRSQYVRRETALAGERNHLAKKKLGGNVPPVVSEIMGMTDRQLDRANKAITLARGDTLQAIDTMLWGLSGLAPTLAGVRTAGLMIGPIMVYFGVRYKWFADNSESEQLAYERDREVLLEFLKRRAEANERPPESQVVADDGDLAPRHTRRAATVLSFLDQTAPVFGYTHALYATSPTMRQGRPTQQAVANVGPEPRPSLRFPSARNTLTAIHQRPSTLPRVSEAVRRLPRENPFAVLVETSDGLAEWGKARTNPEPGSLLEALLRLPVPERLWLDVASLPEPDRVTWLLDFVFGNELQRRSAALRFREDDKIAVQAALSQVVDDPRSVPPEGVSLARELSRRGFHCISNHGTPGLDSLIDAVLQSLRNVSDVEDSSLRAQYAEVRKQILIEYEAQGKTFYDTSLDDPELLDIVGKACVKAMPRGKRMDTAFTFISTGENGQICYANEQFPGTKPRQVICLIDKAAKTANAIFKISPIAAKDFRTLWNSDDSAPYHPVSTTSINNGRRGQVTLRPPRDSIDEERKSDSGGSASKKAKKDFYYKESSKDSENQTRGEANTADVDAHNEELIPFSVVTEQMDQTEENQKNEVRNRLGQEKSNSRSLKNL